MGIIEEIRSGSRAAFDELYRLHFLSLCNYAKLFLSEEEAEDVVQDVFLSIWIRREHLDKSQSIRGYLFRSVYNAALNVIGKQTRATQYSTVEKEIEELKYNYFNPDSCDIIRKIYNKELQLEIDAAIESLPPRSREVFSLSYLEDMSSKEISEKLGISVKTVDNQVFTSLKSLREKLLKLKAECILV